MIILAIRTDKPEAELYLFDGHKQLGEVVWQAHRELSLTLHRKIDELISEAGLTGGAVEGLVMYKGPGSFTGLRIGFSVGNALAYILEGSIVSADGEQWLKTGIDNLLAGKNENTALPEYGAPAATSSPR